MPHSELILEKEISMNLSSENNELSHLVKETINIKKLKIIFYKISTRAISFREIHGFYLGLFILNFELTVVYSE